MAQQRSFVRSKLIARIPKFLSPVVVNAAALVTFTMTLRQASLPPTPLSSEVFFLSESALAQTDPFGVLPVAIGIVAMLNTEVRRRLSVLDADEQKSAGGLFGRAVDTLARTFSVAAIFFAMTNPVVCSLRVIFPSLTDGLRALRTVRAALLDHLVHLYNFRERLNSVYR